MFGLSPLVTKIAAAALAVILLLGFLQVRSCQQSRQQAAQSRVDDGQHDALANSARDAIGTVSNVAGNEAAGVTIGRQNEEAIRHAQGSDARVDPVANAAGLRALCRRRSHQNDAICSHP